MSEHTLVLIRLSRALRSPTPLEHGRRPLAALRQAHVRTEVTLRIFYVFPIFWVATHLPALGPLLEDLGADYLWPVAWLHWTGPRGVWALFAAAVTVFLLAAFRPDLRAVRWGVFFALLEILGLQYSFGKIHHLMHGWLYVAFIFAVFLPRSAFSPLQASRPNAAQSVLAIQAAQTMLCLTYSLAGVGKILGSVYQAFRGEITPLHPSALARHVADRLLQTYPESLLGPWMIDYGSALWPAMLATLYLQLFALVAAFRPRLHRVWGAGLIGFHLVTALSMTIDFSPNILLLALLLVASPLAPTSQRWMDILKDLPIVGAFLRGGPGRSSPKTASL